VIATNRTLVRDFCFLKMKRRKGEKMKIVFPGAGGMQG
jgi:hypothetical protein